MWITVDHLRLFWHRAMGSDFGFSEVKQWFSSNKTIWWICISQLYHPFCEDFLQQRLGLETRSLNSYFDAFAIKPWCLLISFVNNKKQLSKSGGFCLQDFQRRGPLSLQASRWEAARVSRTWNTSLALPYSVIKQIFLPPDLPFFWDKTVS